MLGCNSGRPSKWFAPGPSRVVAGALLATAFGPAAGPATAQTTDWDLAVCADPNALPFSHQDETGFENRIAAILADELGAALVFHWVPQVRTLMNDALREGSCDLIVGVAEGAGPTLPTLTYYRAPYVFVYRSNEDYELATFDDAILHDLRIGVHPIESPAHQALLGRGLAPNIVMQAQVGLGGDNNPLAPIIAAVAAGEIDVAVAWGPPAGYYATQQDVALTVSPTPPFEPPLIQMYLNMVAGVRLGDEALRDLIDIAIVNRWDDIQAILAETGIPTMPLAPPILTIEAP
jgi:quinoprotein dehydrogenase-associated probable ABC transporter substrate-binding protein